jgi:putative hemolysin
MTAIPKLVREDPIIIRTAETEDEIHAAQRLRYDIFYKEYGAKPTPEIERTGRDFDCYDEDADHLIVVDRSDASEEKIIGTYRMLGQDAANKQGQFYSSQEYDLSPLLNSGSKLLELGRSCVAEQYRTRPVLQLLWQGIADYVMKHNVEILFGCASLHGTDIETLKGELAYLHHYHLAPENLRPQALEGQYVDMNTMPIDQINARRMFSALPPLIKGYLRVGATIADGAVIDHEFNTTDVLIVMQTHLLSDRYKKHFERKSDEEFSQNSNAEEMAAQEMESVVRNS